MFLSDVAYLLIIGPDVAAPRFLAVTRPRPVRFGFPRVAQ